MLNNNTYYNVDYVSFVTVMFNNTLPVSVSPLTLNFGSVTPPTNKSLTVLMTNDQSATLTISSISVGGSDASLFAASSNCGKSLNPGFECIITVKFTPAVLGAQSATLSIVDSAGTQVVQLIATNPLPTVKTLSPSSALAGGAGFTLTLTGTEYLSSSVVNWNGSARATTYVSSTELTAVINATDIAKGGTYKVTVTNPAPGGGTSGSSTFTVDNPVSTLISISPNSATHGGKAFTLTATGTNFVSTSVIEWNGAKLTTKYVSAVELTATVPASDIATAGAATVTVVNPTPGGGTSNGLTFTIN